MISLLDIEGTICSISFVKDVLYPFFLAAYPDYINEATFPLSPESKGVSGILGQFPAEAIVSEESLKKHIEYLVKSDIKDPVLKQFQGEVWKTGYVKGDLKAPLYADAIDYLNRAEKVYIYSSGSVAAQKLLFSYVDVNSASVDLNPRISGYYDITTSGYKTEAQSYEKICQDIGCEPSLVTFYSDNIKEIKAAHAAGLKHVLVIREGNAPISEEEKKDVRSITTFESE